MSNWQDKSDFEINKAVAGLHLNCGFRFDRMNQIHKGVDSHSTEKGIFNPCNNPSDAWPIIIDNKISIFPTGLKSDVWRAESYLKDCQRDKNPLRAAMIVYLELNNA